jgi:hypothetical protein
MVGGRRRVGELVTREKKLKMPAGLRLTHKAIGAKVRRGTFDAVVDGERVGSAEMNDTIETPVEPGRHTPHVRNGRNSRSNGRIVGDLEGLRRPRILEPFGVG